jgi:kumamolisin
MGKRRNGSRRIAGSGVAYPIDEILGGPVQGNMPLQVSVVLRPRNPRAHLGDPPRHPAERKIFSTRDLEKLYDPGDDRFRMVRKFAHTYGIRVVEESRARHDVILEGDVDQFSRAFAVALHYFGEDGLQYYAYDKRVHLGGRLGSITENVLGLENIPTHRPRALAVRRRAPPTDIAAIEHHYSFPAVDASGRRIAFIEFGGGYFPDDIENYASRLGIAKPPVTDVPVTDAAGQSVNNLPLDRGLSRAIAREWNASVPFARLSQKYGRALPTFIDSLEVTMDIELALAFGRGAAIDVYFSSSGVDGWRRALYSVIGLPIGGAGAKHPPIPTVLAISWGDSESNFGLRQLRMINRTLLAVQRAGVAVCCSSGDWGSVNEPPGMSERPNVNFPASSPWVLACGGTRLGPRQPSPDRRPESAWRERVAGQWMATGGGVSGVFERPIAQSDVRVRPARRTWRDPSLGRAPGRALPDVAANAALSSGLPISFAGMQLVGFGTSAAAPICASLLARVAASVNHSVAGMEGWLYTDDAAPCCRPVTQGNNDVRNGEIGFYKADKGWSACTGLGALDGERVVATLMQTRP